MILSKLYPNPNKRGAVFTTLGLIFLGMGVARLLPTKISDDQAYLQYILSSGFILFSWDMVNDIVGGAIDTAARKTNEQKEESDRRRNISEEEYKKQQDLEYLAIIPRDHRADWDFSISFTDNHFFEIKEDALARESITRGLGIQDNLLRGMAAKACMSAMGTENLSEKEFTENTELQRFKKDIFIYLKAWVMLSIRNGREMDVSKILQTYPSEQSPDTNAYVQALSFFRDYLVDDEMLDNYLDKKYRKKAREILKNYLTRLCTAIEEAARRRMLKITS